MDRDQHEGLGIQVSGGREVQAKQSVSAKMLRQESASMEKRLRQTMTCITKKTARKMQKLSFTCENTGTRFKITGKKNKCHPLILRRCTGREGKFPDF